MQRCGWVWELATVAAPARGKLDITSLAGRSKVRFTSFTQENKLIGFYKLLKTINHGGGRTIRSKKVCKYPYFPISSLFILNIWLKVPGVSWCEPSHCPPPQWQGRCSTHPRLQGILVWLPWVALTLTLCQQFKPTFQPVFPQLWHSETNTEKCIFLRCSLNVLMIF